MYALSHDCQETELKMTEVWGLKILCTFIYPSGYFPRRVHKVSNLFVQFLRSIVGMGSGNQCRGCGLMSNVIKHPALSLAPSRALINAMLPSNTSPFPGK